MINIAVDLAALGLRRKEPGLARPYRMPFFPLPPLAGIAINLAVLAALAREDPLNTSLAITAPVGAALIYMIIQRLRPRARLMGVPPAS